MADVAKPPLVAPGQFVEAIWAQAARVAIIAAAPAGTVRMSVAATADDGWFLMIGDPIVDCANKYHDLWAAAPLAWKAGSDLHLPDTQNRVAVSAPVGARLGELGGPVDNIIKLTAGQMPSHDHGGEAHEHEVPRHRHNQQNHRHVVDPPAAETNTDGGHNHAVRFLHSGAGSGGNHYARPASSAYPAHSSLRITNGDGAHHHHFNIKAFDSGYFAGVTAYNTDTATSALTTRTALGRVQKSGGGLGINIQSAHMTVTYQIRAF
jgi:hypothetical protein